MHADVYRDIFEQAPIGLLRAEADGRLREANPALVRILGHRSVESLLAAGEAALFADDEARQAFRRQLEEEGRVCEFECRAPGSGEGERWVSIHARASSDGEGRPAGYDAAVQEITARKRYESGLDERMGLAAFASEVSAVMARSQRQETILDHCVRSMVRHLGAALARVWTLEPGAEVLELRASAGLYTHLDGEHSRVPVGRSKIGLIAQEKRPHLTNAVIGDPGIDDQDWARREGLVAFAGYPLIVDDRTVGVLAMFARRVLSDAALQAMAVVATQLALVIERKRAEESLRRSEEVYRLLFENNPRPMWVFDVETLRFLEVNDAAVKHYGYSREEFLRLTVEDIRPAEDLPAFREALRRLAQPIGQPRFWRHRRKDGAVLDVEIVHHAVTFGGRRAELVLVADVTERRRLEEQLRQSQKMEAIGQLAGGVAHDFNNLLGVITGYGDLLVKELGLGHPGQRRVGEIRRAADRAAALTRQLLAFSRRQVLEPRVLDLPVVLQDMELMLRRLLGDNIQLLIRHAPDVGNVRADRAQVEQMIMNLAVNARDAMPAGGILVIQIDNAELDEEYVRRRPDAHAGSHVVLSVCDEGCGMDAETVSHIFEPFFTTKGEGKGTGLGLAMVYGTVRQSGGHIEVDTAIDRGSTFRVHLPRLFGAEPAAERLALASASTGSETVLLVEDAEPLRGMMREVLHEAGYTVLEARSPEDALAISGRHEGPLQLLLTDVVMPRLSGPELASRLGSKRPGLRVLYISGYTDEALGTHGVLDPGTHFLQKPFTPDTLLAKVRDVLEAAD